MGIIRQITYTIRLQLDMNSSIMSAMFYEKKDEKMITHDAIWGAIDEIARNQNITPSRMAIVSGLDATTFNKSKRCDEYGKRRYPSFRTVIKVLNEHNMNMTDFGIICDKHKNR